MKKKIYIALLTMCIAVMGTACGTSAKEESTAQTEEAAEETKEETKEETEEAEEEEAEEEAAPEAEGFGNRLVSVDNLEKYVNLGEYKGITLNKEAEEVTDVEVDYRLQQYMKDSAEELDDGVAQMGDILTIDFKGTKDGVAFDGGTATDFDMVLGEAGFIEGFEDGMVGMKNGESRDLDLTFPEDYFEESLAGQDVVFTVTIKSLKRAPELTDDWAKEHTDYATAEEYRESIKAELQAEAQENADASLQNIAWSTLQTNSEIKEFPEADIENAIAEFKNESESYAKQGNMTMEEFLEEQNISMEDFEAQCRQYAEYKTTQNLLVQAVMDAEGMEIGDEGWKAEEAKLVEMYGAENADQIVEIYGETFLNETVALYRVVNFIIENANIQE